MTRTDDFDIPVPPECRATVDRLQQVLDGEREAATLDADPHPATCAACRERIAAARLVLAVLAAPSQPVALSNQRIDSILLAVHEDRQARLRRRAYAIAAAACVAFIGSVFVFNWVTNLPQQPSGPTSPVVLQVASVPPPPEVRPIRIGDEISRAGQALMGSSKPLTEPATVAPQIVAKITDSLTRPMLAAPEVEPPRNLLTELPGAARAGLEPVTGTAQKAFARLLREVNTVSAKPKS